MQEREQVPVGANVGAAIADAIVTTEEVTQEPFIDTSRGSTRIVGFQTDNTVEGKVTLLATKRQSGHIIVGPRGDQTDGQRKSLVVGSHATFWALNPFTLENGKVKSRGSLLAISKIHVRCPECGHNRYMHAHELRRLGKKTTERDGRGQPMVHCRDCRVLKQGKLVEMKKHNVQPRMLPAADTLSEPLFSSIDDAAMDGYAGAWVQPVAEHQTLILPRIWAAYSASSTPTDLPGWEPGDAVAEEIEQRLRSMPKDPCTIRPLEVAMKCENGAIQALLMEASHGLRVGWVDQKELRETRDYGFLRRFVGRPKQHEKRRSAQRDRRSAGEQFAV